ncbi:MAG: hypothetical protein C0180_00665 [Aciduliprofundum sp.]|nr:MAG: hypothetical protein C0180_00665 [Aciduliprofundum sp.]
MDLDKALEEILLMLMSEYRISGPKYAKYFLYIMQRIPPDKLEGIARRYGVSLQDIYSVSARKIASVLQKMDGLVLVDRTTVPAKYRFR